MSSLGTPLGLGGAQRTSQLSWTVPSTCKVSCGARITFHLAQAQASSAAQHLGSVSDRPGQPANTTFRCLQARRNPGVISFVTTSFTVIIIYLTPRPLGETARVENCQGHDSQ